MEKRVHRPILIIMMLTAALSLTGCAGWFEYQTRTGQPITIQGSGSLSTYQPKNYKTLGIVKATSKSTSILGMIVEGVDGEGLLWEAAINKHGDKVTGLKDIKFKYDFKGILSPIYCEVNKTYYGVAIQDK